MASITFSVFVLKFEGILFDFSLSFSAEIVNYEFDTKNLVCLIISSVVGVWYLLKKVTCLG